MHPPVRAYVASVVATTPFERVIDVGGRNINGSVRDLITYREWVTIDLEDGPDVDVVGDVRTWTPPWPADLVLCLEVLEHTPDPKGVARAAVSFLGQGARLILTCAGPGRLPHSGHDGMPWLQNGEHYENIHPDRLAHFLTDLSDVDIVYDPVECDVRATGVL